MTPAGPLVRRPHVIAHRGASAYAPENTVAAFRAALALGADMVELDVRLTADGRLAVIHDASIDRTCDGRGFVREMTLAEIQSFDAGLSWGPGFAGERVPSLEEVLALTSGRARVNIEIKSDAEGAGPDAFVVPLLAAVSATGARGEVLVSSFDPQVLRALRAGAGDLALGVLVESRIEGPSGFRPERLTPHLALTRDVRAASIHPYWRFTGRRLVAAAHEAGLLVFPWTVNRERDLRRVVALKVDGVITNRPDRLVRVLKEEGRSCGDGSSAS